MIIQIVGLPASGKTTALNKAKLLIDAYFFNIIDYSEDDLCKKLKGLSTEKKLCIVESAFGLELHSHVIKLKPSIALFKKNLSKRGIAYDCDHFEQLNDQIVLADYTAYSTQELLKILKVLIPSKHLKDFYEKEKL